LDCDLCTVCGRAMWLGERWHLNLDAIEQDGDPLQYPELGLGYSAGH